MAIASEKIAKDIFCEELNRDVNCKKASLKLRELEDIGQLWSTNSVRTVREPATGLILERLIGGRDDWRRLIGMVAGFAFNIPGLQEYVRGWARGHFLPGYC